MNLMSAVIICGLLSFPVMAQVGKKGEERPTPSPTPTTKKSPPPKKSTSTRKSIPTPKRITSEKTASTTSGFALTDPVTALSHTYDERNGRPGILAATNGGLYRTYDLEQGWEKISYGPNMDSRTLAIFVSAQAPRTIYVGTATSAVLVSRNSGESWQQVVGVPTSAPVNFIKQDPLRSAYVYVGTKQSLYVSHDGGENWVRRGGNLPYGDFTSILINPLNPDELVVGDAYKGGLFRSNDSGLTWIRVDPPDSQWPNPIITSMAMDIRTPETLYVGTRNFGAIKATRSNGNAYSYTFEELGYKGLYITFIYTDRETRFRIYASAYDRTLEGYFLISNDGGKTWVRTLGKSQTNYYAILQDLRDSKKIYVGTNYGILYSVDGGATLRLITH